MAAAPLLLGTTKSSVRSAGKGHPGGRKVAGCSPNLKAPFFPPFVWALTLALASKKQLFPLLWLNNSATVARMERDLRYVLDVECTYGV